jgi:hypothetical protein
VTKANKTDSYIPWQQWQRHDDAAEAYHRTMARGDAGGLVMPSRDSNIVQVQNNSGADRAKGHILEFTGYYLAEAKKATGYGWLVGGSPTLANAFGVLLQEIKSGKLGDCQLAGSCYALVNVTDAGHGFASVSSATYVLQSASSGSVRIIQKPSGTGEKACWVLIGTAPAAFDIYRGVTDAAIAKGASGTVSRYSAAGVDTTINDTVTNLFADVAISKKVIYGKIESTFFMVAAEC